MRELVFMDHPACDGIEITLISAAVHGFIDEGVIRVLIVAMVAGTILGRCGSTWLSQWQLFSR